MGEQITTEDIMKLTTIQRFPIVVSDCSKEEQVVLERIYPLMQRYVLRLMHASWLENVNVWIFGSSLSMRCNIESDLDIALETTECDTDLFFKLETQIAKEIDVDCDIIYLNTLSPNEQLYKEIRNGLCVRRS